MPFENLTKDQIKTVLTERLTLTGNAKIKSGNLYTQAYATAPWELAGAVADEPEARVAVAAYLRDAARNDDQERQQIAFERSKDEHDMALPVNPDHIGHTTDF